MIQPKLTLDNLLNLGDRMAQELQDVADDARDSGCPKSAACVMTLVDEYNALAQQQFQTPTQTVSNQEA